MHVADAYFAVIDVETTGLDPETDSVIEIACVVTSASPCIEHPVLGMWQTLVNPGILIPAEISGLTSITDRDVRLASGIVGARNGLLDFLDRFGATNERVLVSHNYDFDGAFLWRAGAAYMRDHAALCTKRLAQHLLPDLGSHRNQSLRYSRELEVDTQGIAAHRALADCLVTAELLRDLVYSSELRAAAREQGFDANDVDAVIAYAESPIIFASWPFGKYKGRAIADTPPDYAAWCLREMKDLSRDMRATLQQRLGIAA